MQSMPFKNVAADLAVLDAKVNAFLPPQYQHCYGSVSPTSMGSAGLIYGPDGKVAWSQVWSTFCDLALAGGPPHRGKLLEPVSSQEVAADPVRYAEVVAELSRAIGSTTVLEVVDGYEPGWIGVQCESLEEAAWLQFAVTAENVSARRRRAILQLPAGPEFRIEKEVKNVVVAIAKSYHYWDGHLTATQQTLAGHDVWEAATPDEAAVSRADYEAAMGALESELRTSRLPIAPPLYTGWAGVETRDEEEAVWLLRAVLVEQVLARREGKILYFPVSATQMADQAARIGRVFNQAWRLWTSSSPRRRFW